VSANSRFRAGRVGSKHALACGKSPGRVVCGKQGVSLSGECDVHQDNDHVGDTHSITYDRAKRESGRPEPVGPETDVVQLTGPGRGDQGAVVARGNTGARGVRTGRRGRFDRLSRPRRRLSGAQHRAHRLGCEAVRDPGGGLPRTDDRLRPAFRRRCDAARHGDRPLPDADLHRRARGGRAAHAARRGLLPSVIAIAAGGVHSLALRRDGRVAAWCQSAAGNPEHRQAIWWRDGSPCHLRSVQGPVDEVNLPDRTIPGGSQHTSAAHPEIAELRIE